ncbi:MAG: sodium:solute symporter family protein [Cryomorphaceae bacterium]
MILQAGKPTRLRYYCIDMLATLDWIIIIGFLLLSLGIGLYYRKDAGKSLTDFFLGGRNLPWYVAGLSMVATTFAADTPLAVSELVSDGGVSKNWLWWSFLIGGAFTTFFFAVLWRRANVMTELEFIQIRYEGRPAFYLRLFKSVYLGLFINAIIIAWVNLAMMSLIEVFFDVSRNYAFMATSCLMILAVIYATLSGLKGVAVTDMIQFTIAMVGCIVLAVLVVTSDEIGGITALKETLPAETFSFVPSIGTEGSSTNALHGFGLSIGAFFAFVTVQWWASWYPGSEPGGGGYVAQRMMSTRTEQESVWATLLFQIGHYCVRPWPWILVGLCAIALYSPEFSALSSDDALAISTLEQYPDANGFLADHPELMGGLGEQVARYHFEPRLGFVYAMKDFLPTGLVGLLLVAFFAAYMSTISTQVNWGASYIVNDLILPLKGETDQRLLVLYSRLASVGIQILGAAITPFVTSISGVWEFIMQCGAGLGLVLILRWYWWRINAWSEISATLAPIAAYSFCEFYLNEALGSGFTDQYGHYYFTVACTTVVWLLVTYLTPSPSSGLIDAFDKRVRPMGAWPGAHERNGELKWLFALTACMIVLIVSVLFGIGSIILQSNTQAVIYVALSIISTLGLRYFLKKTNIFERNKNFQ